MKQVDLKRINVLLVDDSRNMLRLLEKILRALGIRNIFAVTDVPDAFHELRVNAIDLAIVDLEMEPLNGLEFVRMLRSADDSFNIHLPIIVLTANTEVSNVTSARDVGVDEFLAKPVSPHSLCRRVLAVLGAPRRFIEHESYTGPDRRRLARQREGPERRGPRDHEGVNEKF